ncbi:hypothetical protein SNE40_006491 [Patella caerulea]|uniref:PHD and RING finger domain-containing protein 1 n=1 Tax=Patella caerulea TaxID=87958 RepID=A0AAN8K2R9_PATCE
MEVNDVDLENIQLNPTSEGEMETEKDAVNVEDDVKIAEGVNDEDEEEESADDDDEEDDDSGEEDWDSEEDGEEGDDNEEEGDDDDDDDEDDESSEEEDEDGEDASQVLSDSCEEGEETCPICLGRFKEQDIGTPESCDHNFCLECIQEWSKNVNTCPVDRQVYHLIIVKKPGEDKVHSRIPVEDSNTLKEEDEEEDETVCEVCGRSDHEDRLLLCDGCDLGYHCECLTPPLTDIPVEEWFCPDCASKHDAEVADELTTQRRLRYQRRIARTRASEVVRARIQRHRAERNGLWTSSEEEEEDDEEEDEEEEKEEQIMDGEAAEGSSSSIQTPSTSQTEATTSTTTSPVKKKKTPTKKRKTKRKTTKRKTKSTKTTRKRKKRKTTKRKTGKGKKRKYKRKTKKKTKKTTSVDTPDSAGNYQVRTASDLKRFTTTSASVKGRIAQTLGLSKPPVGRTIPLQKKTGDKSFDEKRPETGASNLSILGHKDDLIGFQDDDMNEVPTVGAVPSASTTSTSQPKYSKSALLSHRPVRLPTSVLRRKPIPNLQPAVVPPAPSKPALGLHRGAPFDILGSIMQDQGKLHLHSKDVTINRDGTLSTSKVVKPPALSSSVERIGRITLSMPGGAVDRDEPVKQPDDKFAEDEENNLKASSEKNDSDIDIEKKTEDLLVKIMDRKAKDMSPADADVRIVMKDSDKLTKEKDTISKIDHQRYANEREDPYTDSETEFDSEIMNAWTGNRKSKKNGDKEKVQLDKDKLESEKEKGESEKEKGESEKEKRESEIEKGESEKETDQLKSATEKGEDSEESMTGMEVVDEIGENENSDQDLEDMDSMYGSPCAELNYAEFSETENNEEEQQADFELIKTDDKPVEEEVVTSIQFDARQVIRELMKEKEKAEMEKRNKESSPSHRKDKTISIGEMLDRDKKAKRVYRKHHENSNSNSSSSSSSSDSGEEGEVRSRDGKSKRRSHRRRESSHELRAKDSERRRRRRRERSHEERERERDYDRSHRREASNDERVRDSEHRRRREHSTERREKDSRKSSHNKSPRKHSKGYDSGEYSRSVLSRLDMLDGKKSRSEKERHSESSKHSRRDSRRSDREERHEKSHSRHEDRSRSERDSSRRKHRHKSPTASRSRSRSNSKSHRRHVQTSSKDHYRSRSRDRHERSKHKRREKSVSKEQSPFWEHRKRSPEVELDWNRSSVVDYEGSPVMEEESETSPLREDSPIQERRRDKSTKEKRGREEETERHRSSKSKKRRREKSKERDISTERSKRDRRIVENRSWSRSPIPIAAVDDERDKENHDEIVVEKSASKQKSHETVTKKKGKVKGKGKGKGKKSKKVKGPPVPPGMTFKSVEGDSLLVGEFEPVEIEIEDEDDDEESEVPGPSAAVSPVAAPTSLSVDEPTIPSSPPSPPSPPSPSSDNESNGLGNISDDQSDYDPAHPTDDEFKLAKSPEAPPALSPSPVRISPLYMSPIRPPSPKQADASPVPDKTVDSAEEESSPKSTLSDSVSKSKSPPEPTTSILLVNPTKPVSKSITDPEPVVIASVEKSPIAIVKPSETKIQPVPPVPPPAISQSTSLLNPLILSQPLPPVGQVFPTVQSPDLSFPFRTGVPPSVNQRLSNTSSDFLNGSRFDSKRPSSSTSLISSLPFPPLSQNSSSLMPPPGTIGSKPRFNQLAEINRLLNTQARLAGIRPDPKTGGIFKIPDPPDSKSETLEVVDMDIDIDSSDVSSPSDDECELQLPPSPKTKKRHDASRRGFDEFPSSAVDLVKKQKYVRKLHLQERVVEEVKLAIKPFYSSKKISKEEYKEILRKAVPKICHSKAKDVNPMKVKLLVEGYVNKFQVKHKKKLDKANKKLITSR